MKPSPSAFAALKRAAARLELDRRERERLVRVQETCRRLSAEVTRQMAEDREREIAERQRVLEALQQVTRTGAVIVPPYAPICGCVWQEGAWFPCGIHYALTQAQLEALFSGENEATPPVTRTEV